MLKNAVSRLRRAGREFQDYFFPKNCLNCHAEGVWLCDSCKDSLFFITGGFCPFCGKLSDLFSVCEKCRNHTGIKKVFSLLRYGDPLAQKIIKNFKYRYIRGIAEELEPLIRKFFYKYKNLAETKDGAVIVPVPLGWYKRAERGFNQAEDLARVIGNTLNIKIDNNLIVKRGRTKNQANIPRHERMSNLDGAFKAKGPAPKNIILVDDVFTTGATVKEIARVLRSAGAENIQAITLARG